MYDMAAYDQIHLNTDCFASIVLASVLPRAALHYLISSYLVGWT
jgi:hypothetical protein